MKRITSLSRIVPAALMFFSLGCVPLTTPSTVPPGRPLPQPQSSTQRPVPQQRPREPADSPGGLIGWTGNETQYSTIAGREPDSYLAMLAPIGDPMFRTWLWGTDPADVETLGTAQRLSANGYTVLVTVHHASSQKVPSDAEAWAYDFYTKLGRNFAGVALVQLGNEFATQAYYGGGDKGWRDWLPYFRGATRALRETNCAFATPSVTSSRIGLMKELTRSVDFTNSTALAGRYARFAGVVVGDVHPYASTADAVRVNTRSIKSQLPAGALLISTEFDLNPYLPADAKKLDAAALEAWRATQCRQLVEIARTEYAAVAIYCSLHIGRKDGYDFAAPLDRNGRPTAWFERWRSAVNAGSN